MYFLIYLDIISILKLYLCTAKSKITIYNDFVGLNDLQTNTNSVITDNSDVPIELMNYIMIPKRWL